ncbi:hypothetical protein BJX62DRAFT_253337 [Aspergillus germanicus]
MPTLPQIRHSKALLRLYREHSRRSLRSRILEELKTFGPGGNYHFIKADLTLLLNVDSVCGRVERENGAVDLLFLSTGHLGMGQVFTSEALGNNHLKSFQTPRVVSILAAGKETQISPDNLDLRKSYSFTTAGFYATAMTSLSFSHLAALHPRISFAHVFPGFVPTSIYSSALGEVLGSLVSMLLYPFMVPVGKSGEWSFFVCTGAAFWAREYKMGDEGVPLVDGVSIVRGADGVIGSWGYHLNYDGRDVSKRGLMDGYREQRFAGTVWEHTVQTFERVVPGGNGVDSA